MADTLRYYALTATHEDVEQLIFSIVHRFRRRFGGEFETLLSEAHFIFVKAYDQFNGDSKFSTWLTNKVWFGLIDAFKKECRALAKATTTDFKAEHWKYKPKEDPVARIKDNLTEDAKTVLNLVLDAPNEIKTVVENRGGRPLHYRGAIKKHLKRLGWPPLRIRETFEEIKMVL